MISIRRADLFNALKREKSLFLKNTLSELTKVAPAMTVAVHRDGDQSEEDNLTMIEIGHTHFGNAKITYEDGKIGLEIAGEEKKIFDKVEDVKKELFGTIRYRDNSIYRNMIKNRQADLLNQVVPMFTLKRKGPLKDIYKHLEQGKDKYVYVLHQVQNVPKGKISRPDADMIFEFVDGELYGWEWHTLLDVIHGAGFEPDRPFLSPNKEYAYVRLRKK